jgi:hypothetical protein
MPFGFPSEQAFSFAGIPNTAVIRNEKIELLLRDC